MSRLFLRIWLTFWAVLTASFLTALAVDYGLAVQRANSLDRMSPQALADWGADAIRAGGEGSGRHWMLMVRTRLPELQPYVVAPDGRELSGRSPAEVAAALTRPRGHSAFPAKVAEKIGGKPWLFVFLRTTTMSFDLWDLLAKPWVLAGLILGLSGAGAALLARSLARPIRRVQGRVRAIAEGDFEGRLERRLTGRGDELGALARDVDDMAERLQALIASREAILRDVSHELRAPLARLRAVADLARKRRGADATLEATFVRIDREIDRLDALIGQILRLSRLEAETELSTETIDLAALAEGVAEDARLEGAAGNKRVRVVATAVAVTADARLIRSAVENVLRNAVRFSPKAGEIEVRLSTSDGEALLEVLDRGPGVPAADLPHIFEPFHGEGSGAGLGLAIAQRVVRLHGGRIAAANRAGGGLAVTIALPYAHRPGSDAETNPIATAVG